MNWYRMYHGTVGDSKLLLIAKSAGVRRCEVGWLWAALLERASSNLDDRGNVGECDSEVLAVETDIPEADVVRVLIQFRERGMLDSSNRLTEWDKRQPAREREDYSTPRVAAFRERMKRNETHETPCNALKHPEEKRREESRGEDKSQNQHTAPKTGADVSGPRVVPSRKRKHRTTEEIRAALGERLPWWEGFWAVYPCHEGMNEAMDAFERRVHERDLAVEIFRGAEAYAARARADPEMKLKYGQGWLNAERWRDENKIAPATPKKQKSFMDDVTRVFAERFYEREAGNQSSGEADSPQILSK